MKVVITHSRYLSGAASGENRVVTDEIQLLKGAGHEVSHWTPSFDHVGQSGVAAAGRAVWSLGARRRLEGISASHRADVVHVHNVFPNLSPSVLRLDVPTVVTLHNFRLACLPATFLRDGAVCEKCLGRVPWRGVVHGCYRGSRSASAAIAISLTAHRAAGTFRRVSRFAPVSHFIKERLAEAGLPADRMTVRHNFSWPTERRVGPGSYFLSLGRLSSEKGLDTVVTGWRSPIPLVVVGDGPDRQRLETLASPGVEFRGAVKPNTAAKLLRRARALVMPSRWYEGSPRALIEAFAAGVPVIASKIGGLPEHVDDGVSGLLAPPNAPEAWAAAVERLSDDHFAETLGEHAYRAWQRRFSPDVGLHTLEALYREAIDIHQSRRPTGDGFQAP